MSSSSRLAIVLVSALCGVTLAVTKWHPVPEILAGPAGYICVAMLPGLALICWLKRDIRSIGYQAAALGLSPVLTGAIVTLLMLSGRSLAAATTSAGLLFALAAGVGAARQPSYDLPPAAEPPAGEASRVWLIALGGLILVAVFPLMGEGWRLNSDAWFHVAVVSEIKDFGLPPTDPYFSGMPLQYMWLYHVYTSALVQATGAEASWAMAYINLQALACLVLATYALSRSLGGTSLMSMLSSGFILLGMNSLFWVFLPFRLARTLVGDVRGLEEFYRQLSLFSLDMVRMRIFVSVWKSQVFLLDKFIVATAFSLGISLTVLFFLLAHRYMAHGRASSGALAGCALAGIVLYHTPTSVAVGGAAGLALVATFWSSAQPYRRRALGLVVWMGIASLLTLPYFFTIVGAKESDQFIPVGLSAIKLGSVLVSCAAAFILAGPSVLRFLRSREGATYFYGLLAVGSVLVAVVIALPGPNTYDKPPFFAFLSVAPLAGWGLDALCRKGATPLRRRLLAFACLAAIVPNSAFVYAAYIASPGRPPATPAEQELYAWVQENTPRDAVFMENHDRVSTVVLGPRRMIWGCKSYAEQWGYEREEMTRRRTLRDRVYSGQPLSRQDAEQLGEYGSHIYVIVSREDFPEGETGALARSPYLSLAYSGNGIDVYRVLSGHAAPD